MAILREQTTRRRLEMETRWKQGGLRPRVVHESSSEWIRRVSFQWPLAAMGTASGAVLVSECTETGGSPDSKRQRSQRLVASASDAHSRDWANADERGLGERSLLGLYDGGAVTAIAIDARFGDSLNEDDTTHGDNNDNNTLGALVASGGRDGVLRIFRVPRLAVDEMDLPPTKRKFKTEHGAALVPFGEAAHPNVVTSVLLDPSTHSVWTTCLDGKVRVWEVGGGGAGEPKGTGTDEKKDDKEKKKDDAEDSDSDADSLKLKLIATHATHAPALCASLCPLQRVVYVGTADGGAYVFDAGTSGLTTGLEGQDAEGGVDDSGNDATELCRWSAHEAGGVRAIAAAAGGCVTGSSTGPIYAWNYRRGGLFWDESDGAVSHGTGAKTNTGNNRKNAPPRLVSKLLGHVAAVVGLSTGNPAHLVSGSHDGTVRVWDMPRLSTEPGAPGTDVGVDLAGVIDDLLRGEGEGEGREDKSNAKEKEKEKNPKPSPFVAERREALYAVTGHTVWLGSVSADETRILCDGSNNVAMCYDFSEDPDGDGDV